MGTGEGGRASTHRAAVSVGDSIFAAYGRPHVRASPVRIAHAGRRLRRRGGRREFEGHERRLAVQRLERRLAMGACAARRVELARGARHAAAAVVRAVGAAPRRGAVRAAHGRTVILARGLLCHSLGVESREGLRIEHQAGIREGELGCRDGKAERRDALAETGRGDNERARPRLLEDREGHGAGLPRWHLRCRSSPRCRLPRGRSIGGGARDLEDELVVGSRHDLRRVRSHGTSNTNPTPRSKKGGAAGGWRAEGGRGEGGQAGAGEVLKRGIGRRAV